VKKFLFYNWLKAARPKTIPLSISGILVGSSFSIYQGFFDSIIFILAIVTAVCFQVLSNFANDYGDGLKGTDNHRIGPERVVASGLISLRQIKKAIILISVLSLVFSLTLIFYVFDDSMLSILIFAGLSMCSVIAAITYTVGKTPYGYYGFGDIFVFIFFGLISVIGSNFLYTKFFDHSVVLLAIIMGLLCTAVLNINNMRDIENDKNSAKRTIPVQIGFKYSKYYHYLLICLSISLLFIWIAEFDYSSNFVLIIFSILILLRHIYKVFRSKFPIDFKPLLPELAISVFLVSILISIFLINESHIF
jgi:1,4-dihydroxy-2-naphthoate octaprenyltransferase